MGEEGKGRRIVEGEGRMSLASSSGELKWRRLCPTSFHSSYCLWRRLG